MPMDEQNIKTKIKFCHGKYYNYLSREGCRGEQGLDVGNVKIARTAAAAAVMDMDGIKEIVYRLNQVVNWLIIFLFAFIFLNTDREVMMMGIMALTRSLGKKRSINAMPMD